MKMEVLDYLYSLSRFGIKLGLDTMLQFVDRIGNPHQFYKTIHITGTNGKGSTSAMVYSILKNRYITGLYTSPHLLKFNERIIVQEELIPDDYIIKWVRDHRSIIDEFAKAGSQPTFFEVTTAMAFDHFKTKNVEYGVIEVGLGGRLDATNIINPEFCGITSISLEHTDKLGNTMEKIAREKGGIIKKNVPVIVAEPKPEPVKVLKEIASQNSSTFYHIDELYKPHNIELTDHSTSFKVKGLNNDYTIRFPLAGMYQVRNALTALGIIENMNLKLTKRDIENGFNSLKWKGRFEIKSRSPLVIFDAAHNPEAARMLVDSIKRFYRQKPLILATQLKEKNSKQFFRILSEVSDSIIVTEVNSDRKKEASMLAMDAKTYFKEVIINPDPVSAYKQALENSDFVIVTGSIYLLGEIEEWLEKQQ